MFFSIVVPLYNKSYSICRCIDSILSQTYTHFEIIIVNDGSIDNSLSIIKGKYSGEIRNKLITIIDQSNKGVSAARNKGISIAKSDYVCFLDADDEWKDDFLYNMESLIKDFPDAGLYCLQHEYKSECNEPVKNPSFYKEGFRGYVSNFFRASIFGSIANSSKVCINKKQILDLGGFPENYKAGEDLYVWIELAILGKIAFFNSVSVRINISEDYSRVGRSQSIPYPFINYSIPKNKRKLTFWSKLYLRKIYLAHIKESFKEDEGDAILARANAGKALFPVLSELCIHVANLKMSYKSRK